MNRDRIAADIAPGSTWVSDSSAVRVISVCLGYVRYMDGDVLGIEHHELFRSRFEQPYDCRRVRSQFSMSLQNLLEFHAFWSRSTRKMFARSVRDPQDAYHAARGRPALPNDALLVGTYAHPATPDDFLQDLNDLIACDARDVQAA